VAEVDSQEAPRWRRHLFLAVRALTVLVVGYFVVATTVDLWPRVRQTFADLSWGTAILATAAAAVSIGGAMMAWRAVLADLGHRLELRDAAEINLVGQLGKYVPGSVWAYVLQMQLARRVGVPRSRGFLASLIATLLGITAGLAIGSLALRSVASADGEAATLGRAIMYLALAAAPFAIVCAHPAVLSRLVDVALKILRREPLSRPLSWRGVLTTLGWSALGYAAAGLHLWLLAGSVAGTGVRGLIACTAAFALAITAGTFAFVLPSGIGVREVVIAATLAGVGVPYETAFALSLVSRLLFTVADVGAAGAAALLAVRHLRGTPSALSRTP
jgi:glycosyltransferase 2 family protein